MAVVITGFPHQNIPIGQHFSLHIAVSGNPSEVSVDGRLKGFVYSWNGSQNRIELTGTPEVIAENIEVIVKADDDTYIGSFSIVPTTPMIGTLTRQVVSRGSNVTIPIPITGHVSNLVIKGPWVGLRYRQTSSGGEMYGTIPSNVNFTTRRFDYSIEAYNGSVFDTAVLELEIALGG